MRISSLTWKLGLSVGLWETEGASEGTSEGKLEGEAVGNALSDGEADGLCEGSTEGWFDGCEEDDGIALGSNDGSWINFTRKTSA